MWKGHMCQVHLEALAEQRGRMRLSAAPAPGGPLKTLRSYVCGRWHEARSGLAPLVNPSTEEVVAQAGSDGVDFGAVLAYARDEGGPALRRMSFAERAAL